MNIDARLPVNYMLQGLPDTERAQVVEQLEPVTLVAGAVLEAEGQFADHAYFPSDSVISIYAGKRARRLEVAIVGNDGMTGIFNALGRCRATHDSVVQVAGAGWRIPAAPLVELLGRRAGVRDHVCAYVALFLAQVAEGALINGRGSIEMRLVRRLLMASDRLQTKHLAWTHDALALLLGVRRPSITLALQGLEGRGLLRSKRKAIDLVDRPALTALVGSYYTRSPGSAAWLSASALVLAPA